jgi:formate dehydrogenase iron-sulfur subunit
MTGRHSLFGPVDPAADAGYEDHPPRKGFFTDTSICIGCKACEVACKEWNEVPDDGFNLLGMSYDNTGSLNANTWRHVAFIEQPRPGADRASAARPTVDLGMPAWNGNGTGNATGNATGATEVQLPASGADDDKPDFRWLMSSDVCKHCTHAACLDVCPTGSLFRTEFGTVVVQSDICNGCGYCVPACPYGVIERRQGEKGTKNVGIAQKCTLCYDRLVADETPACAKACPTTSIKFGDHDDMVETARERVATLHAQGMTEARLYGANENDGVGGTGSVFLLLDEPEVYGLPPDPRVPTADLPKMYRRAGMAVAGMAAAAALAFLGGRA